MDKRQPRFRVELVDCRFANSADKGMIGLLTKELAEKIAGAEIILAERINDKILFIVREWA